MYRQPLLIVTAALIAVFGLTTSVLAEDGPTLKLENDNTETQSGTDNTLEPRLDGDVGRQMQAHRFLSAVNTSIGGYGEARWLFTKLGEDDGTSMADQYRLVLFIAHNFSDWIRFYSEIEVEHAMAGDGLPGYVAIEQCLLDFDIIQRALTIRAGLFLVPMGITNIWHEPPIFHGVSRPTVERQIIPSTWRELGVGILGEPVDGLRYELYVMSALNPLSFSAGSGIRNGRAHAAEAPGDTLAVSARLEYEPILGTVVGLSGYYSMAGPNINNAKVAGEDKDLKVPVVGISADFRGRWQGLEAKAVAAFFSIGETDELRKLDGADGLEDGQTGPDIGSQLFGAYGEVAYNVLQSVDTEHELLPFVRYEYLDTMFALDGRDETTGDKEKAIHDIFFGVTYRPIRQVVAKVDMNLRMFGGDKDSEKGLNLGLGYMF